MVFRISARVHIDHHRLDAAVTPMLVEKHASLTRLIANQARADVPVRTGALGRSVMEMPQTVAPFRVTGGVQAGGGAEDVDYAAAVHEGSRPHVIRPRRPGGVLRFEVGGQVLFRRSVRHPGMKARPFLRNAGERIVANDPDVQ